LLADALALDPGEVTTQPGMLALELWCLGANGPVGQLAKSKYQALEAGLVAMQARLASMSEHSCIQSLSKRIEALESTKANRATGLELSSNTGEDSARRPHEDIELFGAELAETSNTVKKIQFELMTKAGQLDMLATLDCLRREIVELAATTVGQKQLQDILSTKIGRQDLVQVAELISSGEFDGGRRAVVHESILLKRSLLMLMLNIATWRLGCGEIAISKFSLSLLRQANFCSDESIWSSA